MKYTIVILAFLISALSFGQSGAIKGNLSDLESNNEPLMFAKVSIKENGVETMTDENGAFKFENLKDGTYTLVYSFVGYETVEKQINVLSGNTIATKATLKASSISLDELMLTLASNDEDATTVASDK
ncbi:carboxypeptidase-like regulatory domain-containing protein [Hyunsoonleella rubra]|uniref:Carboxypeptidase-like regulatory domain-containing protein n=1 Tax=Hyunsoonleella rubra TaxID=1737062 RepID=A0ABW5T7D3_9FLAO